jgi:hypothetical protein
METFHTPPARRGLYAFPLGFVESFLLGGFNFRPDRHEWVRDENGKKITEDHPIAKKYEIVEKFGEYIDRWIPTIKTGKKDPYQDWINRSDGYNPDDPKFVYKQKPPKIFIHTGDVWCHLDYVISRHHILKVKGSWILLSNDSFRKALAKENMRNEARRKRGDIPFSKDHMEVFIERIHT